VADERPRLFIGNFDFEAGLVSPSASSSRDAIRRNSELAFAWLAVARPGDVIVTEHLPDAGYAATLDKLLRKGVRFARSTDSFDDEIDVTPWGWERRVFVWADSVGLNEVAPPLHAIAVANSREFSFACERDFGCGLENQAVCCSIGEVNNAVAPLNRWLIKANFGASGRERIVASGQLTPEATQWLAKRLDRDGAVFVEPLVEAIDEAGVQWELPREGGEPQLVGVVPLLSDERGQYRGSVSPSSSVVPEQWRNTVEISRRAAQRAHSLGYFGPLGIDAMRYRDSSGTIRDRPLQDINARWTMGRLALGWRDLVPETGTAILRAGADLALPNAKNVLTISPEALAGEPLRHRFWIETSRGKSDADAGKMR
jgi:hypothetical protein